MAKENYKIKSLGQVFTPEFIAKKMINLIKNGNRILEPSCGDGVFLRLLKGKNVVGIEKEVESSNCLKMDFFDYPIMEKFDTIIGNPPYVAFKDIIPTTKKKLPMEFLDKRSNLFLYFIYKSFLHLTDNGEIIFITPRDFFSLTSSIKLNNLLYENGTITDVIEFGDERIFGYEFSPNVVIWRYEKNNFDRRCNYNGEIKYFYNIDGHYLFLKNNNYTLQLKDIAYVKVGGVTGANNIFNHESGNIDVVCSYTKRTGKTKRMIYNIVNEHIKKYKKELIKRKIRKFDEKNWFKWGRDFYISNKPRVYVNTRTRDKKPFFIHNSIYYDGTILGIFPKKEIDIIRFKDMLNNVDWEELGFVCDGRYMFNQRKLENTILPKEFEEFL
ncbi:adenine-specific DNA-methyltransferase [Marinitoga hydrogenitolerans DSM 16785]|uniref:site-specific DNA-methyltransferase (adenine-specific) n=1 Tax=Marinitoga hydrogenitolerans (strain DSM 16785 / JCM 12826 / AT1271) TaxID=1122195 RepID=A0A1M4ULQ1_MARH1|nr:class I SAM-dependent methyltransferase [Marinitoga hydrogenitolerans]SHE57587.1 adenine-specific DNA-methyltransferase [Marinitoga hydrogenitolerans DSM 16785]